MSALSRVRLRMGRYRERGVSFSTFLKEHSVKECSIAEVNEDLLARHFQLPEPLVVRGLASSWPAVSHSTRKWSNLRALRERVCEEDSVVPIEVGQSYMDPDLQKHQISLASYIDFLLKFESTDSTSLESAIPKVYLAQHSVQDIAVLRDDILVPSMCTTTGKRHQYASNIWFSGPRGSTSPCHFDPFYNVLVQIVGQKEVLLVDSKHSDSLYPAVGTLQKNTSLVDFAAPDFNRYPLLGKVEVYRTVLSAGDALFMPLKWWHYCHSPGMGCSVNFWWL